MSEAPLVTIVMPVRNERANLDRAFQAIDDQTYPRDRLEVIVVDGGSTDGTVELVRQRMGIDRRISLLGGDDVNTPLAMELGRAKASGQLIAKVDGHGWINGRFVETAVAIADGDSGIGCVGGLIDPVAVTEVERAIAIARFSRFGVGGGIYNADERPQDVDTVQCGVYRREALAEAGGFDASLPFGEDEEANFRLRQAGWRIRLEPRMRFSYRVRSSLGALLRQYFRYGRARVAVVRKHPNFFRAKHAIPALMVIGLMGSVVFGLLSGWQLLPIVLWGVYAGFLVLGATWLALSRRFRRPDLLLASLTVLHLGYGLGTLRGLLDRPARLLRERRQVG